MKRKILGRNVFDPRIFLMLCSGTENQKHGSQNNQKNSNAPLLESREFVGVSVSRKSFYVHHGYFGKQIAFVRSFFSGIFILFSIDGIYVRIFGQIRNTASVFERYVFERVCFCQASEGSTEKFGETAKNRNHQIPQTDQDGNCRCNNQKDIIFHVLQVF